MDEKFWHDKWKTNQIGFNQKEPGAYLQQYFPELKLKQGDTVFVPLCGKSIDMLWLLGEGYKVIGCELSKIACEAFFRENHIKYHAKEHSQFTEYQSKDIVIYAGDYFLLQQDLLEKAVAVYDRAALIALPKSMRHAYVSQLRYLLPHQIKMLLITMSYEQTMMDGPPFSIELRDVDDLYGENFDINELLTQRSESVSPHLKDKGLICYNDHVFMLTTKTE